MKMCLDHVYSPTQCTPQILQGLDPFWIEESTNTCLCAHILNNEMLKNSELWINHQHNTYTAISDIYALYIFYGVLSS